MLVNPVAFNANNDKLNFGSITNPVKPFSVTTKYGTLTVSEIDCSKGLTPKFVKRLTRLYLKNVSEKSNYEPRAQYYKATPEKKSMLTEHWASVFNKYFEFEPIRKNLTLLVAKDERGYFHGLCVTHANIEIPDSLDTTLYVNSLAVNKKYRKQGLAQAMLEKSIEANKNTFTDVYLTSLNASNPFYEKMGFVQFNPDNPKEQTILDFIRWRRCDYNDITPYYKPLQINKPRWFEGCAEAAKNVMAEYSWK